MSHATISLKREFRVRIAEVDVAWALRPSRAHWFAVADN